MENLFDDLLFEEDEGASDDACPGCGSISYLDGVTEGCYHEDGCGKNLRDGEDLDDDSGISEIETDTDEEEDEDLEELDFDFDED